jgi:hypothetical protein
LYGLARAAVGRAAAAGVDVVLGHGARHLAGTGLAQAEGTGAGRSGARGCRRVTIHISLHVVERLMVELEVYKEDLRTPRRELAPEDFASLFSELHRTDPSHALGIRRS